MPLRPHNPPKHHMFIIQKLASRTRNKELAPIAVLATIRHTQQPRRSMLDVEVLVGEGAPVDGDAACAVAVEEVAALDHEGVDCAVEDRVFVAHGFAGGGLVFAGAELAEVFDGSGVSWRSRRVLNKNTRIQVGEDMFVCVGEERKGDFRRGGIGGRGFWGGYFGTRSA